MPLRYRAALALTSLALLGCWPGRPHHPSAVRVHAAAPPPSEIYSRRALRRARTILQLQLLQLRLLRLDRIRQALEHRIPIDQLLREY